MLAVVLPPFVWQFHSLLATSVTPIWTQCLSLLFIIEHKYNNVIIIRAFLKQTEFTRVKRNNLLVWITASSVWIEGLKYNHDTRLAVVPWSPSTFSSGSQPLNTPPSEVGGVRVWQTSLHIKTVQPTKLSTTLSGGTKRTDVKNIINSLKVDSYNRNNNNNFEGKGKKICFCGGSNLFIVWDRI